jgi:hypothetical protein
MGRRDRPRSPPHPVRRRDKLPGQNGCLYARGDRGGIQPTGGERSARLAKQRVAEAVFEVGAVFGVQGERERLGADFGDVRHWPRKLVFLRPVAQFPERPIVAQGVKVLWRS